MRLLDKETRQPVREGDLLVGKINHMVGARAMLRDVEVPTVSRPQGAVIITTGARFNPAVFGLEFAS